MTIWKETALALQTGACYSAALGKEQPFAYALPHALLQEPERRFPMILFLHGHGCSYKHWAEHTQILRYAARYSFVLLFAEGENSWYANAFDGTARYEDYIVGELAAFAAEHLPVKPPGKYWAAAGMSMGGYGALLLGLKHPGLFGSAVSLAGALEANRFAGEHHVFGDPVKQISFRRQNDLYALAEEALCRWPIQRPAITLECGLQDSLLEVNRRFHQHLQFIGYGHTYREVHGHHTWPCWNRALRTLFTEWQQLWQMGNEERN